MSKRPTVHIVSHTHWDPEWYSPFREYQMRLIPLVDKLLRILEENDRYSCFMFDGQVSALLNYLEVKPENSSRIEGLVRRGKLLIGPFFLLPDEYMVSPEGIIRNLLWGIRESKRFGAFMPVAYLCDMAGHPPQMPQVLNLFGLTVMVAWRGVLGSPGITRSEFFWRAPDGSRVLFLVMPFAYVNFGRLPRERETILKIALDNIEKLSLFASTSHYLLMEGHDHQEPREDIPELIDFLNSQLPEYHFIHSSLPQYAESVRSELSKNVPEYEGELRATQTSFVLPGVLSTRIPLKKEIRVSEAMLERVAEPLASLADMLGLASYPSDFLRLSWKIQFNNQFHDVIYGAHVDEVAEEAAVRSHQVFQISKRIAYGSGYLLACECSRNFEKSIVVVNPLPYPVSGVLDFSVQLEPFESMNSYAMVDENGTILPFGVEEVLRERNYLSERNLMDYGWGGKEVKRIQVFAQVDKVPPFGCKVIGLEKIEALECGEGLKKQRAALGNFMEILPSLEPEVDDPVRSGTDFMENSSLRISFEGGKITLEDKRNGKTYPNFGFIEDSGDRGDHYLFSPPDNNIVLYSSFGEVSKVVSSPLKAVFKVVHNLKIPKGISEDRTSRSTELVEQGVEVFYTLRAGAEFVEIKVRFENKAANRRMRIGFGMGRRCTLSEAEVFFDVVKRDVSQRVEDTFWPEKIPPTRPKDRFVFVGDEEGGLLFVDGGWLKEYEVTEEGHCFVTLLRCSDFLSVDSLPERSNSFTGPKIPTPGAQYLGTVFETEIVVYPLTGHWSNLSSYRFADHFLKPLYFQLAGKSAGGRIKSGEGLIVLDNERVLMSALKKKEDGDGWVLRLWNPLDKRQTVRLCLSPLLGIKKCFLVNGLEERIMPINFVEENVLLLEFEPKKILNLELSKEG